MTSIFNTFDAPFRIEPVLVEGEDKPAIFVLKDANGLPLGGFQDEGIGKQVMHALNAYAALRDALASDPRLARHMKRTMRAQTPKPFAGESP